MRSRKVEDLNADILEGHYSAALCHLANISYRLGQEVPFNKPTKAFGDDKEAYETLARMEEHLKDNKVRARRPELPAGPQADLRRRDRVVRRRLRGEPTPDPALPRAVRGARPNDVTRDSVVVDRRVSERDPPIDDCA